MEMQCVLCEVGADFLCIIKMNSVPFSYHKDRIDSNCKQWFLFPKWQPAKLNAYCLINQDTAVTVKRLHWLAIEGFFLSCAVLDTSEHICNPLKHEFHINYTYRFTSYLTVNTLHLHSTDISVYSVYRNNHCLLWELYRTHKYAVCMKCGVFCLKEGGTYNNCQWKETVCLNP